MRTGNIARLPADIRDQLNRRLENGSSASRLLPWLNALPEVRAVLKEHFHSRPITAPNLSRWTHDGYRDWLHLQGSQDLAHCLTEDTATFTTNHTPLTDTLNHWIATRLALQTRRINELTETDPEAADKLLSKMTRELVALQRAHTQARREQRHREQLAFRQDQLRQKAESAREQTIADHEAWALHPANQDRLWRALVAAYPDEYAPVSNDPQPPASTTHPSQSLAAPSEENLEDDIENESEEDFDGQPGDDSDDSSSVHSESGPAAGTVILSAVVDDPEPAEREGPHTSAPASTASPHQSAHEGPSHHSRPSLHQPSLPPAVQAAIHDELSITRTELRILRLRMGLPPDPVQSRKEAVSCL